VLGDKEGKNENKRQLEIWKEERAGWICQLAFLTKTVSDDGREI
jgi:hypothetical protein